MCCIQLTFLFLKSSQNANLDHSFLLALKEKVWWKMSSRYQILYFYTLANLQKRQKQAPFAMAAVWADTHVE